MNFRNLIRTGAVLGAIFSITAASSQEGKKTQPEKPDVPAPKRITAFFELIEIDRADWNAWLAAPENSAAGPGLRDHVQKLLAQEKATLVETVIVAGSSGERLEIESNGEYTYPTSGDPPEVAKTGKKSTHLGTTACETRNTGLFIELSLPVRMLPEPQIPDAFAIEVPDPPAKPGPEKFSEAVFHHAKVLKIRDDAYGKDHGETLMPAFHTIGHTGVVQCWPGKSLLVSSHRPVAAKDPNRKDPVVLAFLRFDVIDLVK